MSNTFVTPRVVTTISQSRIDYNESVTSLLQNFASAGEPDPLDISLEGSTGLRTGMFWYKSGTDTTDGQGRFLVYDGTSFTRNGIGTYQMTSGTEANTAATAGVIEYGDLILLGTDELFMVNSAGSAIKKIGGDASTLSGLVSTQFLRSDESDSMTGSLTVSGDLTVDTSTLYVNSTTDRVGIGTTSPGRKLDVQSSSGDADIRIYAQGTAAGDDAILYLGIAGASATNRINFGDASDADRGRIIYDPSSDYMSFSTAALEAVRIDSSGNVGIGTSNPASALDVVGTVTADGLTVDGAASVTGNFTVDTNTLFVNKDLNRVGVGTTSPAAQLHSVGADGVNLIGASGVTQAVRIGVNAANGAYIEGVDDTLSASYEPLTVGGSLVRFTTSNTERMRIDSSGDVGIGTTSPSEKLHVVGNVLVTGDVNSQSDEALKENIATLEDSLDSVKKLRGVSYTWKENGKESIGLIAQEVEQIEPKLVSEQDGLKSVKYGNVVAILIEAVKELSAKVEELESKLDGR